MNSKLYPSYISLFTSGELNARVEKALEILSHCTLCPWKCGVNRLEGEIGQCQTGINARVYSYMPHHGEEQPLRGKYGSGTIFFSGCNMHCQFCQNADISQENYGMLVSNEKLAQMMLELQARGCHNINLVSPTHVVPQILSALQIAADDGLQLPIVYNTGGYDAIDTLLLLDGIIDIYMPDIKYASEETAERLSLIHNYPYHNRLAVKEMFRQVGDLQINEHKIAIRGLIIRHLVLPHNQSGTEETMIFISKEISQNSYVNIMDQYRPEYHARQIPEINRRTSVEEFQFAVAQAIDYGISRIDHLIV